MAIHKSIKNTVLASIVAVGTLGGITKTSDYFSKQISKNFKTHYTADDIEHRENTIPNMLTHHNLSQALSRPSSKNDIATSMKEYTKHSLPQSNYSTDSSLLTSLVQNRIESTMFPGGTFPTGLEEFNINIRKEHGDALCASAIWAKLRMLNIRSEDMRKFFAQQGKHSRFAQQLLSQHGRKSTITSIDGTEYYNQTHTNKLHPHYKKLLNNLHHSRAGNIITSRYASSGSLQIARHEGKNATHSILSLGTIRQELSGYQLGIEKGSQIYTDFIKQDIKEQNVILVYQLLKTRAIKDNMVGEETKQKDRIRMLLEKYPHLLSITTDTKGEELKIIFNGVMGEHVYPIAGNPTNYIHYLFELVAYNGGRVNNDGSVFLVCDEMTPTENAIKDNSYHKLSPLYNKIETVRKKAIHPDMILSTYIVSFDDIDINGNKKIDRGDKTIAQVLDEMSEVCYRNSHIITKVDKKNTKEYLKKYLHILGAIDRFPTGTLLPIPYLTEENRAIIDESYQLYITENNDLEQSSQRKYSNYILKKLEKTPLNELGSDQLIVYPVCSGDDPISITQQIGKYIDKIVEHNPSIGDKKIKLGNLSREEYNRIFKIIQGDLVFPDSYPKQALRANQKVYINLAKCIASIDKQYYKTKTILAHNHIPPVEKLEQFDEIYTILDINESTKNIQKHIIIRETGGSISVFDIAKTRSRIKMNMEYLDFDNNSILKNIQKINSEGPLQIRLDYYISAKNDIELIVQSSQKIIEKSGELGISNTQQEQLKEIIKLSTELQKIIIMLEKNNLTTSQEFQEKRGKLKYMLSDIIDLTGNSLQNPKSDLGALLSIQISAYTIERYLWRYRDMLQEAIGENEISKEEFSFIQHFTIIAHHLGQKDADAAFKIYMSIHLMWTAKELGIISQEQNNTFQTICKNLNTTRRTTGKLGLKKHNNQRYQDRFNAINNVLGSEKNEYIQDILKYSNPANKSIGIPPYKTIRENENSKGKQDISINIFDAHAAKEFSLYLTTIPPETNGLSAILLYIVAIVGGTGLYRINRGK